MAERVCRYENGNTYLSQKKDAAGSLFSAAALGAARPVRTALHRPAAVRSLGWSTPCGSPSASCTARIVVETLVVVVCALQVALGREVVL